jgi:hypothetical protein
MLVVANQLIHSVDVPAPAARAAQATPPESGFRAQPRPARRTQPVTVKLAVDAAGGGAPEAGISVEALVSGGEEGQYVRFYVDGCLRVMSNVAPYTCRLDPATMPPGPHRVRVEVMDDAGSVSAFAERTVDLDETLVAGP